MSLVIAIRDKNRFVLGSDKQSSTGDNKAHTCTKIWEVSDLPGAIMGSTGCIRAAQVCQYNKIIDLNDLPPDGLNTNFIVNSLVPMIVNVLGNNGVNCNQAENKDAPVFMMPNSFIFAYADKAWMIWHDLSVTEVEDYIAVGSGSDVANGALYATKDKNPFERIVTSIDAAAETTLFVDHDVDFLATDYYEEDEDMLKALSDEEIQEVENKSKSEKKSNNKQKQSKKATKTDKK